MVKIGTPLENPETISEPIVNPAKKDYPKEYPSAPAKTKPKRVKVPA